MTPSPSMNPERSDAILRMLTATVANDADAQRADSRRTRTRGIVIASMAFAVIVVVGGVGYALTQSSSSTSPGPGGIAAPTSSPSSSVAPSPTGTSGVVDPAGTATPVPTPTPTATANDPTDVDSWLITTDGVGPLDLGQTFDQAAQEFGVAGLSNTTSCPNGPTGIYAPKDGPVIYLNSGLNPTISFITIEGDPNATGSAARSGGPRTPHGIGIGSTSAQLHAAYPDLEPAGVGYWDATGYSLTDGAGKWINFVVSNKLGTVQEIVVNDNNEVPSEFCG